MIAVNGIYRGQAVAAGGAAKLNFTTLNSILNGLSVVPAGCVVLLTNLFFTNITNAIQTLQIWAGTAATNDFLLGTGQAINIPPSTELYPGYQALSAPIVLEAGDSIWALCGNATSINVRGDGEIITQ